MPAARDRRAPAHDGARFDTDGFCLAHADVRLRRLAGDGTWRVVRKVCFKCGSATLARGARRRTTTCRDAPREARGAGDGPRSGAAGRPPFKPGQDLTAHAKRSKTPEHKRGSRSPPTSQGQRLPMSDTANSKVASAKEIQETVHFKPPPKASQQVSSGNLALSSGVNPSKNSKRAQAPGSRDGRRRLRRHSISLFSETSSAYRNRRATVSGMAKKTVTREKIRELRCLLPPPAAGARRADDGAPFDGDGYCRAHPDVRLARRASGGVRWEVVSGVCPRCCASAVLACRPDLSGRASPDDDGGLIGRVVTTGSAARPVTPAVGPVPRSGRRQSSATPCKAGGAGARPKGRRGRTVKETPLPSQSQ